MQFFEKDSRDWVVFIDTDGDRAFTNRTKLDLTLAQCIAVPTEVNDNDARRMEYFTQGVQEMRDAGESVPPIDVFILNNVNVVKWLPMTDEAKRMTSPFSPAKSTVSEIDRLSGQLAAAFFSFSFSFFSFFSFFFFCPGGNVDLLPRRFVFPEMTQTGRLSSSYGCPVVALPDNITRLRRIAASEHLDLASLSVSSHLVNAVNELAEFLDRSSLRDQSSPHTPEKGGK